MYAITV